MPATGNDAERLWRRVYTELGDLLEQQYKPQEVVDLFYEFGVIESPVVPADFSSVRAYVVDTLSNRLAIRDFLRRAIPRELLFLSVEGANLRAIGYSLQSLGYTPDPEAGEMGETTFLPPKRLPRTPMPRRDFPTKSSVRVSIPDLPAELQELVDELNDNLDHENQNAAALLVRKIISQAVFVALAQRGKSEELKKPDGDDLDLMAALRKCKEVCGVSSQVMGRVTSAKWIGDAANHSYRVKPTDEELERAVTGTTLFLREILSG